MRKVFAAAAEYLIAREPFALATILALYDAMPAPAGTTIAVDARGRITGSLGAGCHESEIVETCLETMRDGRTRCLEINLRETDDVLGGAGCGGSMSVAVWRPDPAFAPDAAAIAAGDRDASFAVAFESNGKPERTRFNIRKQPTLLLVGATAIAAELAAVAGRLDFRTVVVDPRPAFATHERLPAAHEIVRAWPDAYLPGVLTDCTPIVMLSHDPKFDLPALQCALRSPAPYIGLLGSRRAQAARREVLRRDGFDEASLARIHGPAGLDVGGVTPAETALSILAEIVASQRGRAGAPLRAQDNAIHGRDPAYGSAPE